MLHDFGKAAFGTIQFEATSPSGGELEVRLGEKLSADGFIDMSPGGCIRAKAISLKIPAGTSTVRVAIPPDERNTGPRAIPMPPDVFEVLPFRYAEITGPAEIRGLEQLAVFYPFDDGASAFVCDDDRINQVWDLCKYSIKATSFCGVYVDGDRERIPYEGDAYINQLCHYGVDAEYELARHSLEYLLYHPTWPTEWSLHCVPMAWADYQYTGRPDLLETHYHLLRKKTLLELAREDGLISTQTGLVTPEIQAGIHLADPLQDLVDWPPGSFTDGGIGERDNYEMVPINTVVNAFHYWNLELMAQIAGLLGRREEAGFFAARADLVRESMHRVLFDHERGVFTDGEGSAHASLHANCFPAAFGLVPAGAEAGVLAHIKSRGMACSVYGAQYLLEAVYRLGDPAYAVGLMTAEHDRGWLNMIRAGSTVTLEAWDIRYKLNLDWNHAWGAVPANILPRFVAGVTPEAPGFAKTRIAPRPGGLKRIDAKVPTPRGPVTVSINESAVTVNCPTDFILDLSAWGRAAIQELPAGRHELRIG